MERVKTSRLLAAVSAATALAGCGVDPSLLPQGGMAGQNSGIVDLAGGGAHQGGGGRGASSVDLLPMLDLSRPAYDLAASSSVGGYTRIYVDGDVSTRSVGRSYAREDRGFWRRALAGRSLSRVLTVSVEVQEPDFSFSRPLASASHDSNRTVGEAWKSELSGDRVLTPYFRIGPRTVVGVEVDISATSSLQGSVTGDILSVIASGVELASPTSSLVTSLNEERYSQAADFVDDAISKLFGEAITERSVSDVRLSRALKDNLLGSATASFPDGTGRLSTADQQRIGVWSIKMEAPIVSIHSTRPLTGATTDTYPTDCAGMAASVTKQACAAFDDLSPHTVLGLSVGEDLNLLQSLLADTAVQGAIKALEEAGDKSGPARSLCSALAGHAENLGLNRYDEAAAVWAFARSGPISAASSAALLKDRNVCDAVALAYDVKLVG